MKIFPSYIALLLAVAAIAPCAATDGTRALEDYIHQDGEHRNLFTIRPECETYEKYIDLETSRVLEEDGIDAIQSFSCNKFFGNEYVNKMMENPNGYFQGDEYGICKAAIFYNALEQGISFIDEETGKFDIVKCNKLFANAQESKGRRRQLFTFNDVVKALMGIRF